MGMWGRAPPYFLAGRPTLGRVRFVLPDGEVSGVYSNGEEWRVKFSANGTADVKDAHIAKTLEGLAADPDHPLRTPKGN